METSLIARTAALAEEQQGVVGYAQLLALGVGKDLIRSWLRTGRLTRLHKGVYAYGHTALTARGHWWAALLACGDWVVLGERSTLQLLGHVPFVAGDVHVVTRRPLHHRPGITVHRTRRLTHADVTSHRGLETTTLARSLLDYGGSVPYVELRRVADLPKQLDLVALRACLARCPGHPGSSGLLRLLSREEAHTKSEFERRWLRVMPPLGVPWPDERNVLVAGHKVDLRYPRTCVELDGRAWHAQRAQMQADRHRDSDLLTAGERPFRVVWEDLDRDFRRATAGRFLRLLAS